MHHYVKPICGIYKITHKPTGFAYIGQGVDIFERLRGHTNFAQAKKDWQVIKKALYQHGVVEFTFEVIEECPEKDLNKREAYWIKYYNCVNPNGYNQNRGSLKVEVGDTVYFSHGDSDVDFFQRTYILKEGILVKDGDIKEVQSTCKFDFLTDPYKTKTVFKHKEDAIKYVDKCHKHVANEIVKFRKNLKNDIVYVCHVYNIDSDDERASLEKGILSGITDEGLYEVTFYEKLNDGTVQNTYDKIFYDEEKAQEYVNDCESQIHAEEFLRSPEFQWELERMRDKND